MTKQRKRIVVDKVSKDYEEAFERAQQGLPIVYYDKDTKDAVLSSLKRTVDDVILAEYGKLDSIPDMLRAIIKELVKARLERV